MSKKKYNWALVGCKKMSSTHVSLENVGFKVFPSESSIRLSDTRYYHFEKANPLFFDPPNDKSEKERKSDFHVISYNPEERWSMGSNNSSSSSPATRRCSTVFTDNNPSLKEGSKKITIVVSEQQVNNFN